jgi:hypothetical protein
MRRWLPLAIGGLIVLAYAFFYALNELGSQGASSFGFANSVGLIAVVVGLIAAGFLMKRASPPQ